jgi:FkbM family methyltransferase
MYQTIFNAAIHGPGEVRRWGRRLRRLILKCSDPIVTWKLNGRPLRIPLSHELPLHRQEFPTYAANLERLASAVRRADGRLVLIDVGANIGDSVALAGARPEDACLLIEGDPRYGELLRQNTADLPGAVCVSAMLSDRDGAAAVRLVTSGGTGHVIHGGREKSASVSTLDRIVEQHGQFSQCNLLKVDVDGYDLRVLRGGIQLIRSRQPILLFEQHPALLERAQEEPDAVWDWLEQAGYTHLFVYDNLGYWLGTFDSANWQVLQQLNRYARQRSGYYYDVAAFGPRREQLQKDFAASEQAFYAGQKTASVREYPL